MMPTYFESHIGVASPGVQSEIDELLRAISEIDSKHESNLGRIEQTISNKELKIYLVSSRNYEHQLDRQPYVDRLNKLRLHRQSPTAEQ
ncbi:hypothetical protein [Microvirga tunisiensis]|uniref:Uncharacterized protein n=1 Tax=Microvirga tunisiensis TaxID=2108360 RepID=A0A5N7MLR4_9HYPH|nr:hypothetical protein [Microvirga tunisiensis]MPR09717.1 hypothetical protein [Microvirga tunisiensis]MPR27937.1 hypothetical protein [Microvirga tunisiensis]